MKPITIWSTVSKDGKIKHNHIQDGHVQGDYPEPLYSQFTNQKAWKNIRWKSEFAYLTDDNKVVRE